MKTSKWMKHIEIEQMNTDPCASDPPDCGGVAGGGDGDKGLTRAASALARPSKLVFERQGEFARELLCFMFETGAMADVEVITDDSRSIRSHVEVLVRVSGYFRRTLLQGNLITLLYRLYRYSSAKYCDERVSMSVYDRASQKAHVQATRNFSERADSGSALL